MSNKVSVKADVLSHSDSSKSKWILSLLTVESLSAVLDGIQYCVMSTISPIVDVPLNVLIELPVGNVTKSPINTTGFLKNGSFFSFAKNPHWISVFVPLILSYFMCAKGTSISNLLLLLSRSPVSTYLAAPHSTPCDSKCCFASVVSVPLYLNSLSLYGNALFICTDWGSTYLVISLNVPAL